MIEVHEYWNLESDQEVFGKFLKIQKLNCHNDIINIFLNIFVLPYVTFNVNLDLKVVIKNFKQFSYFTIEILRTL